jgi:hypothetical protein
MSPSLFLLSQNEAETHSDHSTHHAYNITILYQYYEARTKYKERKDKKKCVRANKEYQYFILPYFSIHGRADLH